MAKVFIEETTLTAIGDAIRGKEGTTELVPVNDMATRISDLPEGGGGGNEPTDEELAVTGDCTYRFALDGWNWFIDKYGDRITTKDITRGNCMFYNSKELTKIPFQINVTDATDFYRFLHNCISVTVCPKVRGTINWTTSTTLAESIYGCSGLRDLEDLFTADMLEGFSTVKVTSAYSCPKAPNFSSCDSLRTIPSWWYKFKLNEESTALPSSFYCLYSYLFNNCYSLDEITNLPVWSCQGAQTADMFSSTFVNCYRVKNVTFETNEDGTAIETQWKSQTIDLSRLVGAGRPDYLLDCNNGITADKEVTDDATYQALKNDPDWFSGDLKYSRYNHDSAVATINSLPDTSAYLAEAGGTNTIKFMGANGSLTDGGAINTLTEEEIAVATAKGWTVTLV